MRSFIIVLLVTTIGTVTSDMCAYCDCDFVSEVVVCSRPSLLVRTVSLFSSIRQLHLNSLKLPQPPHFLFHSSLSVLRINRCHMQELLAHTFLPLPSLEVIDLSDNQLQTLPPTVFCSLKSLRVLILTNNKISDLASLTWILEAGVVLEQLDLSGNPITHSTSLTVLPPVRQLFLSDTGMQKINASTILFAGSDMCSGTMEACRQLPLRNIELGLISTLDVSANRQLKVELSALDIFHNVSFFDLSHSLLPDGFSEWLENRSRVRSLNVSHAQFLRSSDEWGTCGQLLHSLDISGIGVRHVRFSRFCPLRSLFARDNLIATAQLEAISLESLHFERNLFAEFPALPDGLELSNLHTLSLSNNLLTTLQANALKSLPNLQHLDLSHNQINQVGSAVAVGEQPVKMLVDPACGARMTLAETLTNLVFAPISAIEDVKMSGNWMFAAKCAGEGARLVRAVDALCQGLIEVGCAIDGGKDSLSMATKVDGELVKAPGTLVLSAYAPCTDVTKVLTPTLQAEYESEKSTTLLYIRMGSDPSHHRLGGSSLAQVFSQIGDTSPDIESFAELKSAFKVIQRLITENKILSGHDVSDGGLITTIAEMAFAGNCTVRICVHSEYDPISVLFAEECGIVIEVANSQVGIVCKIFESESVAASPIGFATAEFGVDAKVNVMFNDKVLIEESLNDLREEWEELGDKLGVYQTTAKCLEEARTVRKNMGRMHYKCNFDFSYDVGFLNVAEYFTTAPKVAIIREEGSNGDREMAAAFALAGFEPFDVTMTDLLAGLHLNSFRGAAFVGGFSYADVLGSAKGWAASILFSDEVRNKFELFRRRSDTFSLGVCNGCQLMAHIGWIAGAEDGRSAVFLDENECGRFESSFSVVRVDPNPSLMLRGMHGSVLGVWSSHGEGRFTYRTPDVLESLKRQGLVCLRYANEDGASAVDGRLPYPLNPNGSEFDVAAICSNDGRHLAMMPHPDRSFLSWQWPEYPNHWKEPSESLPTAPWVKIFRNAYDWCTDINQI